MLLGSLQLPAFAQDSPPPPSEEVARYTVELIIFAYEDSASSGNEIFMPERRFEEGFHGESPRRQPGKEPVFDDRSPAPDAAIVEPDDGGTATLQEIPSRARVELHRLERDAFGMTDAYARLARLDAYRPIMHTAWTQSTQDRSQSPTLPLRAIGDPPLGLDGTITLYRSRFLHLDIDLSFDAGPEAAQNAQSATDRLVNGDDSGTLPPGEFIEDDVGLQPPLRYRIVEDRIMRDGEIRYFDHPRFGMLARVTREEASDATEAGDGPGQGDSRD